MLVTPFQPKRLSNILGLRHVSGEKIAKCVLRKANARLKFLYRQGKYLNFNCRKLFCSALIQCLLDYASCSWFSGLNSNFKNKLQTTRNKIVGFFTNQGPRSHVGQYERSQIGYPSVDDRVKFLRLCHTHKIFYNISAPYLHDNFVRVTEVHRYNTRSKRIKNLNQYKSAIKTHLANCALQKE